MPRGLSSGTSFVVLLRVLPSSSPAPTHARSSPPPAHVLHVVVVLNDHHLLLLASSIMIVRRVRLNALAAVSSIYSYRYAAQSSKPGGPIGCVR